MEETAGVSQQTDITLVNNLPNASLGPPPPIPLHTKPNFETVCALSAPCLIGEQVENSWVQALATQGTQSTSDDEYFSADEEPVDEDLDNMQPPYTQVPRSRSPSPITVTISDSSSESDIQYWSNVPDFDYTDDGFSTTFSLGCSGVSGLGSTAASGPLIAGPSVAGPSTLIHTNTSHSVAAHPLSPSSSPSKRKKKSYYTVTRGRRLGVFKSWHIAKASITGVDGLAVAYDTLQEAWAAFDEARELKELVLFE